MISSSRNYKNYRVLLIFAVIFVNSNPSSFQVELPDQNHMIRTKWLSFLVSMYIWVFIGVTICPLFLLYLSVWILTLPFDRRKYCTHYFTALWARLYLGINPGWKIRVENPERLTRSKYYILVSNHQSIIDIALLLQLRINFKWVAKMELARVPFIGWVIWLNHHIFVRRGDKQSVLRMAEACRKSLAQGISVLMFPEGTRTKDGALLEFREGAFIMARDNSVPMLPVLLDGAMEALPKGGFWFRPNQVFTIRILDEIPVETIQQLDQKQLIDHTRNEMDKELKAMRSRTLQ